jgi:hypothetical protein
MQEATAQFGHYFGDSHVKGHEHHLKTNRGMWDKKNLQQALIKMKEN